MKSWSGLFVLRFRLQTMLVLVTAFSISLGLVSRELHREHRRDKNAAEVRRLGGRVSYNLRSDNEHTGIVNGYLRIILGDKYFEEAMSAGLRLRRAEDLDLLIAFPEMKRLRLGGDPVTDKLLERLSGLSQLESLDIEGAALGEAGITPLKELPSLRSLRFANCSLADRSFQSLAAFPNLNSLEFDNCLITDRLLHSLTQSSNLLYLSFGNCSLSDSNLEALHGGRGSVRVGLYMTDVTEAGMLAIREANPAWSVMFSGQSLVQARPRRTDIHGFLPSIQDLPEIDKLTFQGPLTSDATLAVLKDARGLISLELSNCSLTDNGLQSLRTLQNLEALTIVGTPITDEGVRALEGLGKLRDLNLALTKIAGLGLGRLPPSIRKLNVSRSGLTDRGVAEIARLAFLDSLNLGSTLISDAGIADLAKMSELRKLYLFETPISAAGASRLQRALPDCFIQTK